MADKSLKFWTESPNVFLVAISSRSQLVLGSIAYEQITSDTIELGRLSVDPKNRGLGIGWKLTQHLINTARENGYKKLYVETTSPQFEAINLYRKFNFTSLGKKECKISDLNLFSNQNQTLVTLCGFCIVAFSYKL